MTLCTCSRGADRRLACADVACASDRWVCALSQTLRRLQDTHRNRLRRIIPDDSKFQRIFENVEDISQECQRRRTQRANTIAQELSSPPVYSQKFDTAPRRPPPQSTCIGLQFQKMRPMGGGMKKVGIRRLPRIFREDRGERGVGGPRAWSAAGARPCCNSSSSSSRRVGS